MNEIFIQRGPAGGSHVARVNFKTSCVGVYKCLSRRLCRHCRNLAEGGCLLSRFHFMRCRYFLGHVACWNLAWQGLYKCTGSDQSIDLCILRDSCHELFSIFGDFYVLGTQDAEVTKSLISLFSVHVNYFVPASIVSWGTKLPYMVWQTVVQKVLARRSFGLLGRFWPKYRMAWENSQKFACELPFEEWVQKFETDHLSLPSSRWCFWLVLPQEKFASTNQKHNTDLGIVSWH